MSAGRAGLSLDREAAPAPIALPTQQQAPDTEFAMTTAAEQVRAYKGPAILSFGFRPFFLAGALWAAIAIALWLPMLTGQLSLPSAFAPIEWHVHELIYGYVPAIIAGFLLLRQRDISTESYRPPARAGDRIVVPRWSCGADAGTAPGAGA